MNSPSLKSGAIFAVLFVGYILTGLINPLNGADVYQFLLMSSLIALFIALLFQKQSLPPNNQKLFSASLDILGLVLILIGVSFLFDYYDLWLPPSENLQKNFFILLRASIFPFGATFILAGFLMDGNTSENVDSKNTEFRFIFPLIFGVILLILSLIALGHFMFNQDNSLSSNSLFLSTILSPFALFWGWARHNEAKKGNRNEVKYTKLSILTSLLSVTISLLVFIPIMLEALNDL